MTQSHWVHRPYFEKTARQQVSHYDTNTPGQYEQVLPLKGIIHIQINMDTGIVQ